VGVDVLLGLALADRLGDPDADGVTSTDGVADGAGETDADGSAATGGMGTSQRAAPRLTDVASRARAIATGRREEERPLR
jgi:hypothetical protein